MITARVTDYRDGLLIASVSRQVACSRCLDGRGCGMGLIGRRTDATVTIALTAPEPRPEPGSRIQLTGAPGVVRAAMLGYGLPLAGVLAGAAWGPAAAAAGLVCGVALSRLAVRGCAGWQIVDGRAGT